MSSAGGFQMGPIEVRYLSLLTVTIMPLTCTAGLCKGGGLSRESEASQPSGLHGGHNVLPHHDEAGEGGAAEEGEGREDCEACHGAEEEN